MSAPLTISGAADLVARELRAHDRQAAYQAVEPNAYAAIRRAQRVLFACVAALEDPALPRASTVVVTARRPRRRA